MTDRLDRFRRAQDAGSAGFASALEELRSGRKSGHWIWYIFPQLAGLGESTITEFYSIQGADEAFAYVRNAVLRERLVAATAAVAAHLTADRPIPLRHLMGTEVDAMKLVSSLTLFGHVAETLAARENGGAFRELADLARVVLEHAEADGYPRCSFTLKKIGVS